MKTSYLSKRNKALQYVEKQTLYQLNSMTEELGLTAVDVANKLEMNRANCSRLLNSLHQEGELSKRIGKPTFFISQKAIKKTYPSISFPSIISKDIDVYSLLKNSNEKQKLASLEYSIKQIIGSSQHESLFSQVEQVKKISNFPGTTGSLLIKGLEGGGQSFFIKKIIQMFELNIFLNRKYSTIEIDALVLSDSSEILNQIQKNLNNKRIQVVVIKNFDFLTRQNLYQLRNILHENIQRYQNNNNFFILATHRPEKRNAGIKSIINQVDHELHLPSYITRTAKEKVEFIFHFLQKEADLSSRTITADKNTICCLGMSGSITTLHDLRKIIRQTIMNALNESERLTDEIIINISNIPAKILDSIYPSKDFIEELNSVFSLFEKMIFNFIPYKTNKQSELLRSASIDSNQLLNVAENQTQSLEEHVQRDVSLADSSAYITIGQLSLKQKKIYTILDELKPVTKHKHLLFLATKIHSFSIEYSRTNYYFEQKNNALFLSSEKIMTELFTKLELSLNLSFTDDQKMYVTLFIYYSNSEFFNNQVAVIMSANWNKISQTYADHFNRQYGRTILYPSNLSIADFEKSPIDILEKLKKNIALVNQGKGVLIISDSYFPKQLKEELTVNNDILILENLTFNSISKIVHISMDKNSELSDFKSFQSTKNSYPSDTLSTNLIKEIETHILKKNLAFLDSEKALNISSVVLHNILEDLNIEYQNEIAISFLLHTCFMIERVLRNIPLNYKGLNKLISKNNILYHSIETRLKKIDDTFSIVIPSSEIAYIVEIFVDYLKYNQTNEAPR